MVWESEFAVSKGLDAAIPAIASTIATRADDEEFVKNLADVATKAAAGASPITNADTTDPVGGWLSSLFARNLPGVTGNIAGHAIISAVPWANARLDTTAPANSMWEARRSR